MARGKRASDGLPLPTGQPHKESIPTAQNTPFVFLVLFKICSFFLVITYTQELQIKQTLRNLKAAFTNKSGDS